MQSVTQISFHPKHRVSMVLSGPNGLLEYRRIDTSKRTLDLHTKPEFEQMRIELAAMAENNITSHSWSDDAEYFGLCTDMGYLYIANVYNDEVVFAQRFDEFSFVSM